MATYDEQQRAYQQALALSGAPSGGLMAGEIPAWLQDLYLPPGHSARGGAPAPAMPYGDPGEIERLQSRAAVMSAPTLRDEFGAPPPPGDPTGYMSGTIGASPAMQSPDGMPSGVPAPGTGFIQGPDGKVTFLGGNPYDQGQQQQGDQLPGGLPSWAYPLKTTRYRRSGQPDLEVVQAQVPGTSARDIALANQVAPAFKSNDDLKTWFKQTTGRDLPEGFEPQSFRTEKRAEQAAQAVGTEREITLAKRREELAANQKKVQEEGIAIDRSFDSAMTGLNERMTAANNLLSNRSGLWQITGAIGGQDIPEALRTDKARRALADYEQVQAQTFVEALERLKNASKSGATGLGQLTEIEGKKIQTAIAALKRTQSYEDFSAKLQAYQKQLQASQERLMLSYQAHKYGFPNIRAYEEARRAEINRRMAERGTQGGGATGAY